MEMLFPVWNVCFIILLGCLRYNKFPYFGMIHTFAFIVLYAYICIGSKSFYGWNRQTSWYTCKMAYYDDCYNCCNSTYTVYFIKSNGWN